MDIVDKNGLSPQLEKPVTKPDVKDSPTEAVIGIKEKSTADLNMANAIQSALDKLQSQHADVDLSEERAGVNQFNQDLMRLTEETQQETGEEATNTLRATAEDVTRFNTLKENSPADESEKLFCQLMDKFLEQPQRLLNMPRLPVAESQIVSAQGIDYPKPDEISQTEIGSWATDCGLTDGSVIFQTRLSLAKMAKHVRLPAELRTEAEWFPDRELSLAEAVCLVRREVAIQLFAEETYKVAKKWMRKFVPDMEPVEPTEVIGRAAHSYQKDGPVIVSGLYMGRYGGKHYVTLENNLARDPFFDPFCLQDKGDGQISSQLAHNVVIATHELAHQRHAEIAGVDVVSKENTEGLITEREINDEYPEDWYGKVKGKISETHTFNRLTDALDEGIAMTAEFTVWRRLKGIPDDLPQRTVTPEIMERVTACKTTHHYLDGIKMINALIKEHQPATITKVIRQIDFSRCNQIEMDSEQYRSILNNPNVIPQTSQELQGKSGITLGLRDEEIDLILRLAEESGHQQQAIKEELPETKVEEPNDNDVVIAPTPPGGWI